MKMRIMGTEEECAAMVNLIRSTVPKEYIKSISSFYPNKRQNFSNEGYIPSYAPIFTHSCLQA